MQVPSEIHESSDLRFGQVFSLFDRGMLLLAAMLAMSGWVVMTSRILSDTHPIWDLASHFSWHTWVALSVVLTTACFSIRVCFGEKRLRWWHRLIMGLPPWLYLTWVTTPWSVLPLASNYPDAKGLKILSWNIWVTNSLPEQVLKLVQDSQADVVALIEVGPEQAIVLKQLELKYPYCHWIPDHSSRGIALLSRVEGTHFRSFDLAGQGMPAIEADVPATEIHSSFRVMAVHTRSPDLHQRTLDRNEQLRGLSEWAALPGKPRIIVGDLNITPWSPPFSRMLRQGKLEDSRSYRGNFASWPTDLWHLAIPIDHALVTKNTTVLYRSVGASAPDSDHRPIMIIVK